MYILQSGDYKSWISIDGKPRPVFGVEATLKTITCWIPSENNKKFSVNWHNQKRATPIQAIVEIDGVLCNNHIMLDAENYPNRPHGVGVSYTRTSEFTRRDFMFSTIQVNDDDTYPDGVDSAPMEIGTIKLQLWKLHVISVALQHQRGAKPLEGPPVHERCRKPGAHHVVFGDEYASPALTVDEIHGYRTEEEPFMTFIFKYRPIDTLVAHGIISLPNLSPTFRSSVPYSPPNSIRRKGRCRSIEEKVNSYENREAGPLRSKRTVRLRGLESRRGESSELTSPEISPHERIGFS